MATLTPVVHRIYSLSRVGRSVPPVQGASARVVQRRFINAQHVPVALAPADYVGTASISGTVSVFGTPTAPARRRVRLIHEITGALIGETFSDATTGAFTFPRLNPTLVCSVVAYDPFSPNRAEIWNGVSPT